MIELFDGIEKPCYGQTDLFFEGHDKSNRIKKAKKICRGCRYRAPCEAYAIRNRIEHGIFGGFLPDERASRAWLLEQLEPTAYVQSHRTLDALAHHISDAPSFPSYTASLDIGILLVSASSVEEQTSIEVQVLQVEVVQSVEEQLPCPPDESNLTEPDQLHNLPQQALRQWTGHLEVFVDTKNLTPLALSA